jgi:hypothetical protein
MSKSYILGIVVGIILLTVGGAAGSKLRPKLQQGVSGSNLQQIDEEEKYKAEIGDATPVELGVLTNKQRIHSKLYTYYLEMRRGRTISGLVASVKGKSKIVKTTVFVPLVEMPEPEPPEKFFGKHADTSDAIVRGVVTTKISQITEDDSFVFTDYDVVVTEVLKNKATAPIETGATINVTRPGGKVLLDGIIVKATDQLFAPFSLGREVILFLKFVPESGTYKATDATGCFEIDGLSLRPLTDLHFPSGVLHDKDSFLQTLRVVTKE